MPKSNGSTKTSAKSEPKSTPPPNTQDTHMIKNLLVPYIRARYSVLYLVSPEESRAELMVEEAVREVATKEKPMDIIAWSHTEGLKSVFGKSHKTPALEEGQDPVFALKWALDHTGNAVFIFRDLHPFMEVPKLRRLLRDISRDFKQAKTSDGKNLHRTLVIMSPVNNLPEDLRHDVTLIDFSLPDAEYLGLIVDGMIASPEAKKLAGGDEARDQIIEACKGLTTMEAQDAVAKSLIIRKFDSDSKESIAMMVMKEKANALRKTGILEYYHTMVGMDSIGGLATLKQWLEVRQKSFTKEAREFGLPMPRGFLLAGVPGCGKSLAAKATAAKYGVPLIRLDIGRIFGGLVGQSESNMRTAIQTAEAIGQCVLWVDEIDKAFAGMMSGNSGDSGVSQRVFGNFITWMQEKTVPVFIVATANRIAGLPPELMRKGRFDEIFFVDLPDEAERAEILGIHVHRRRPNLKLNLEMAVELSDKFSGAELEEAVISAMYQAFASGKELSAKMIEDAITGTNPLAKTRADEVEAMRSWAVTNAVNASLREKGTKIKKGDRAVV